jgi:hypothetical protein
VSCLLLLHSMLQPFCFRSLPVEHFKKRRRRMANIELTVDYCTRKAARFLFSSTPECEHPFRTQLDWSVAEEFILLPKNQPHVEYVMTHWNDEIIDFEMLRSVIAYLQEHLLRPFRDSWGEKGNREPNRWPAITQAVRHFCIVAVAQKIHANLASDAAADDLTLLDWLTAEKMVDACKNIVPRIERIASVFELYSDMIFLFAHGKRVLRAVYAPMILGDLPQGYTGYRPDAQPRIWEKQFSDTATLPAIM